MLEENTNYSDVDRQLSMPYLNSLANQYGLATQYYADTHPSIGNYLMLTTGQILTNDDTQTPAELPGLRGQRRARLLTAGKTWKAYADQFPSVGYLGDDTIWPRRGPLLFTSCAPTLHDRRADQYDPAAEHRSIHAIRDGPGQQCLAQLFVHYANGCDDAHDCSLSVADNWLKTNIDPLLKSAHFQKDGLLLIVFDESGDDNTNGGGHVAAIIVSPFAKLGYKSTTFYQHESILRLMLEGLGVTTLARRAAASAPKMWEFFTFTPPT